jgi:hypothetical protein
MTKTSRYEQMKYFIDTAIEFKLSEREKPAEMIQINLKADTSPTPCDHQQKRDLVWWPRRSTNATDCVDCSQNQVEKWSAIGACWAPFG